MWKLTFFSSCCPNRYDYSPCVIFCFSPPFSLLSPPLPCPPLLSPPSLPLYPRPLPLCFPSFSFWRVDNVLLYIPGQLKHAILLPHPAACLGFRCVLPHTQQFAQFIPQGHKEERPLGSASLARHVSLLSGPCGAPGKKSSGSFFGVC